MKTILQNKLQRLETKRQSLKERALESNDAAEVRSINDQLEDINAEIEETRGMIKSYDEVPAGAKLVNGNIEGGKVVATTQRSEEDPLESKEYRMAFREYALRGTPIPAKFKDAVREAIPTQLRNGQTESTADMGAAIPMTIMNEIINTVRKRYGNLYNKTRKLSVTGGVAYPVGALQATFKWISEATVSPNQKLGDIARVMFGYNILECRVSHTFLSAVVGLSSFEGEFGRAIAIAFLQAMDLGIVRGTGVGQMLGILNDPRVTNTITMTAAQFSNWTNWRKNFFAKLPLGYEAGEFIFPRSTVEGYLLTMADSNNRPIYNQATGLEVFDGDDARPYGRFFGRDISVVEPDIIPDFDTAAVGDVIGIYWQPREYAINENYGFTVRRYFNEETNEWIDKALVVVDGKVLNPEGYYKIVKG